MKEAARHKIEISVDSEYSQEVADWLNKKGHAASIGGTTENFINAVCAADDNDANEIMRQLWEEFRMDGIYVH